MKKGKTVQIRGAIYALLFLALSPSPAHADMGLPMLILVWPGSWILLLPIIALESFVATRTLKVRWREAFRLAGLSNLFSTLVGIPVTWGICLLLEVTFGTLAGPFFTASVGNQHFYDSPFFPAAFTAPWLLSDSPSWVIPVACLSLCIPFYFMSVWTEGSLVRRLAKDEQKSDAMRWAWRANAVSYGMIALFLLGMIVWYAVKGTGLR